ncbi:hypothetical protein [Candidatus Halocynthiibacter alkanivorans]|uniref:hypothetical protein n=1 Tax=Candidatus Halocynthiibacter alkanivorans TaxID=2267619 RepID=UPI00109C6851|nr:hypothetical protein [Candidatus Halocynthiibacter alkanivorans]
MTGYLRAAALLGVLIILMPSISPAKEITRTVPVTEDFYKGSGDLGDGPKARPSLEYAFKIFDIDGQMEVCGLKVLTSGNKNRILSNVLREGAVRVDGKSIIRNLNYFAYGKPNKPLVGQLANCKDTGKPVPTDGASISVYFRKGRYTE